MNSDNKSRKERHIWLLQEHVEDAFRLLRELLAAEALLLQLLQSLHRERLMLQKVQQNVRGQHTLQILCQCYTLQGLRSCAMRLQ